MEKGREESSPASQAARPGMLPPARPSSPALAPHGFASQPTQPRARAAAHQPAPAPALSLLCLADK